MRVLVLDTALGACQAALLEGEGRVWVRSEPMSKGHQERLAPMTAELMAERGVGWSDVDRIGVTVGPGSFTGLRVGLAFAKGLSLALRLPCVGVGTLAALAASAPPAEGVTAAVIDARRDRVYLQAFRDGAPLDAPAVLEIEAATALLRALGRAAPVRLVGPGAALLAHAVEGGWVHAEAPDPAAVARLAAAQPAPVGRPAPLYLREPDARTIAERAAAFAAS